MADAWFYASRGNRQGPVPAATLRQLAQSRQIAPDDLVWTEGMPSWQPAKNVPGLFDASAPQAAPAPQAYAQQGGTPAYMNPTMPQHPGATPAGQPQGYPQQGAQQWGQPQPQQGYQQPQQQPAQAHPGYLQTQPQQAYAQQPQQPQFTPQPQAQFTPPGQQGYAQPGQPVAQSGYPQQGQPVAQSGYAPQGQALPAKKGSGLVKVLIGGVFVLLIALCVLLYFLFFRGGSNAGLETAAAKAPKDAPMAGGLASPSKLIKDLSDVLDEIEKDAPGTKANMGKGFPLGINPLDGTDWDKSGYDSGKPLTFAGAGVDEFGPTGEVMSVGTKDEKKSLDFLKEAIKTREQSEPTEDKKAEPTVWVAPRTAYAAKDGRLYVLEVRYGSTKDPADLLRTFLKQEGGALSSTDEYKNAVANLPGGDLGVFVSTKTLPAAAGKTIGEDVPAIGISGGDRGIHLFVLLSETSKVKEYLKPGANFKAFMNRFDQPIGAIGASIEDPGKMLEKLQNLPGGNAAALTQGLQQVGMTKDDLDALLKNGAMFGMFYEKDKVLMAVKVSDAAKLRGLLEKDATLKGAERRAKDNNQLWVIKNTEFVGVIDDWFVTGTAIDQADAVLKGSAKGWTTKADGTEQLYGEVDIEKAKTLLPLPNMKWGSIKDGSLQLKMSMKGKGVLISLEGLSLKQWFELGLRMSALKAAARPMPNY